MESLPISTSSPCAQFHEPFNVPKGYNCVVSTQGQVHSYTTHTVMHEPQPHVLENLYDIWQLGVLLRCANVWSVQYIQNWETQEWVLQTQRSLLVSSTSPHFISASLCSVGSVGFTAENRIRRPSHLSLSHSLFCNLLGQGSVNRIVFGQKSSNNMIKTLPLTRFGLTSTSSCAFSIHCPDAINLYSTQQAKEQMSPKFVPSGEDRDTPDRLNWHRRWASRDMSVEVLCRLLSRMTTYCFATLYSFHWTL